MSRGSHRFMPEQTNGNGDRTTLYTLEIESFDTTPPKEEAGDDNE